jgi:hypothetical protein
MQLPGELKNALQYSVPALDFPVGRNVAMGPAHV